MNEDRFQVISPADQSVYAERSFAGSAEIEAVLEKSKLAQKVCQNISLEQRQEICTKAVQYFVDNADKIGEEISWQMGRPVAYSKFEIARGFRERANCMIEIAGSALSDVVIEKSENFHRRICMQPLGSILVLSPWNYPYLTSVNVVIPAILAGNSVILKHSTQTPLCAERYFEAFEHAGLPTGIFQYLHIRHDQASDIIRDRRIDYVSFTGSVHGGKSILRSKGDNFIQSGLELGGKDAAYVCTDADIPKTAEDLADGVYFNSGQSCCGIERIYLHRQIADQFIQQFLQKVKDYKLGYPLDPKTTLGPMVRISAAGSVRNQIHHAILSGAKALIDPEWFQQDDPATPYLAPQLLTGVNHQMEIMIEETFGPVAGIVTVENDEEAVTLMNDSRFGLTASVWTADEERAFRIASKLEVGTCFMNRCDYLDPALPWSGTKNSGLGHTLSHLGYGSLTKPKSFHFKIR